MNKNTVLGFLRKKDGGMYIDVMIALIILTVVTVIFVTLFPIFSLSQELNQTARVAARMAEVTGRIGDEVEDALHNPNNMEPDTVQWITTYKDPVEQTIQLKTPFTVILQKEVDITVVRPFFGPPLGYTITLTADASGVSEVYWK